MIIRATHTCRVGEVSREHELNIEEPLSPEGWALPLITPNGTVPAKETSHVSNVQ